MKRITTTKVCAVTICVISIVSILRIAISSMTGNSTVYKTAIVNNRESTQIDGSDLMMFEQETREKFKNSVRSFSVLEKQRHIICVRNLQMNRQEDRRRYKKENAEPKRHSHLAYLKPDSVVIEVGGNRGHDTSRMVKLYDPVIITLEPVETMAKRLKDVFKDNKKVTVLNFGLGKVTDELFVEIKGNNGEATSIFTKTSGSTSLILVNTTQFLLRVGVQSFDIDLFLINCEGCEYEILETIISSGLVNKFKNIQFQAHNLPGIRDPDTRYCKIEVLLNRTHSPTYRYRFLWEHWKRND